MTVRVENHPSGQEQGPERRESDKQDTCSVTILQTKVSKRE